MGVVISKPAINLREQLTELKAQQGYEEQQFHFDNLVTNGTFDTDISGWTATRSASLASVSSQLVVTCGAVAGAAATQTLSTVAGRTYKLTVDVVGKSGGRARVGVGTNSQLNVNSTYVDVIDIATGTYTVSFTATADISYVHLSQQDQNFTATFDNIFVYEVDPNDSNKVIHTMPKGWKPLHVFEDGALQREGSAYDYTVEYDGFNYVIKETVAPVAPYSTTVIGVRA